MRSASQSYVRYSYSAGEVSGSRSTGSAGGIAGDLGPTQGDAGTVIHSYSVATVKGNGNKGGLVGKNVGSKAAYSYFAGVVTSGGTAAGWWATTLAACRSRSGTATSTRARAPA